MGVAAIIVGILGFLLLASKLEKISEQLKQIIDHLEMIRSRITTHFPP
jgi:predicted nucleic acid-binding protein